jgi:serine/threonine protein kinase
MAGVNFDFSAFQHLDHPNLVPLTEHLESEHFHILIKPYVSGIDLHTTVQRHGPLSGAALSALIDQLTSAIAYLHNREKALIFRDLKPSNIIVSETPTGLHFTIIDIETMRKTQTDKTSDTYFVLSHGFSSPEQYGYQQSDPRSDIYSLGATLFYAITGEKPDLKSNLYRQLVKQKIPVSRATALAIDKCLSFDPARRFRTIKHFKMALRYPNLLSMLKKDGLVASVAFTVILIFSIAFGYANARLGENDPSSAITDNTAPSTTSYDYVQTNTSTTNETDLSIETEPSSEIELTSEIESETASETTSMLATQTTPETIPQTTSQTTTQPSTQPSDNKDLTSYGNITLNGMKYAILAKNQGVILTHISGQMYNITVDPSELPPSQSDIKYMGVGSYINIPSETQIQEDALEGATYGYGIESFNYLYGYYSNLIGNHYVVFLYDQDLKLLGYRVFKNILTDISSYGGPLSYETQSATDKPTEPATTTDVASERIVTLDEGVTLGIRAAEMILYVDPFKLPAEQSDLSGVVIMGNVKIGDQKQLENIIEEIEVLGRYIRPYRSSGVNSGYGGLTFDTQSWYIIFVNSHQKVTRVIPVN